MIDPCCYWCGLSTYDENFQIDCEARELIASRLGCKSEELIVEPDSVCIYGHYCFYPNKLFCEVMD